MTEGVALEEQSSYGRFIREAFIDPIRTVIVVDDEFPTFEGLIDKETSKKIGETGWKPEDIRRVREIIKFCREDDRKWMVEINDGQFQAGPDTDPSIAHLHQSDLLILDYHLDPANQNDGVRAIQILRHLARNDHFNLVVVFTKGYEGSAGPIEQVAREIALCLSSRNAKMEMNSQSLESTNQIVEEWEDESPGISNRLLDSVDEAAYLKVKSRCDDTYNLSEAFDLSELQAFMQVLEVVTPAPNAKQRRQILRWALHHRQDALGSRLWPDGTDGVQYEWNSDGTNWIRTERLFVTVVGKANAPQELPEKLAAALEKWNPEPHRLLMSRLRAELDEKGVLAEGEILGNYCLQAGWLEEFLTEDSASRAWKIHNSVTRHWESLGSGVHKKVMEFSERLACHLLAMNREKALDLYAPFKMGEKRDEIALQMNRYACSKQVEGHHLTTGHILRLENGGQASNWLCLSPACDLVPGQKTSGWAKRLDGFVAFTAVELFHVKTETALSKAFGGNHIFLEVDREIKCFSFAPPLGGWDGSERVANPKWEQMFADNQGCFTAPKHISLRRVCADKEGSLTVFNAEAQVVAQLRYEYALNLLQRLGANLSRVGLDFIQPATPPDGPILS